jgi:hypothetical protein
LNCDATTAPTAAIANRLAIRAIALFTPDAMPAFDSSASANTVAVSGATVAVSPNENTSNGGSRSVTKSTWAPSCSIMASPTAAVSGPRPMNSRGP